MKIFRLSVLLSVAAAIFAGAMLFMTSQRVQQKENELAALTRAAKQEAAHIRVLRAEWDYLNRPDRLERLVSEHMGMDVPESGHVLRDVNHVPEPLMVDPPARKPLSHAQPVSLRSAPPEKQADEEPAIRNIPPRKDENFNSLLEKLKKGGAE